MTAKGGPIKVLTIKQPWAQLIICGAKDIENREWHTGVRGRIAVHASKKMDRREIEDAADFMASWMPRFSTRIFSEEALTYPTGAILGTVEIVDCVRSSDSPWFVGSFGFVLKNPIRFACPIPARGELGFWSFDLPTDVEVYANV